MKNYIKPSLILVVLIVLGGFVYLGAQSNQNNFNPGTGTGSGTVSANNGSAGAVANYAGAGGSTTVGPDANLVDAANLLTYSGTSGFLASAGPLASGANGGAGGIAKLFGATSGSSTITGPAVGGTAGNPIVLSNALQVPALASCSTPEFNFTGRTNWGLTQNGASAMVVCGAGAADWGFAPSGQGSAFYAANNMALGFSSGSTLASIPDTVFWRLAANVMQQGTDTANDETGLMRNGQTCRITADVSLTVNVANSFCSWSLPASAKPWSFSCNVQWAITAGSGTNNFALGVNPSQTPTGTTNGEAQIYTAAPANTSTMGSAAISASGATTILTGATYTPAATVQFANISGTLLASGTAGTFAIQATANGTTATAAVKAGSSCQIF